MVLYRTVKGNGRFLIRLDYNICAFSFWGWALFLRLLLTRSIFIHFWNCTRLLCVFASQSGYKLGQNCLKKLYWPNVWSRTLCSARVFYILVISNSSLSFCILCFRKRVKPIHTHTACTEHMVLTKRQIKNCNTDGFFLITLPVLSDIINLLLCLLSFTIYDHILYIKIICRLKLLSSGRLISTVFIWWVKPVPWALSYN